MGNEIQRYKKFSASGPNLNHYPRHHATIGQNDGQTIGETIQ